MGSACVEACDDIAVLVCSYGELGFVPVIKRFFHSYDRLHGWILKLPDSDQIVADFIFFEYELLIVGHFLNLAATALSGNRTFGFYAVWGRLFNFDHSCIAIIFLGFYDFCLNHISNHRIFDKQRISVYLADSFSTHANIFYFNFH